MAAVKGILPTALLLPLLLLLLSSTAVANVEKTIFLGPDAAAAVAVSPGLQLSDLVQRLDTLTPANGTVRTRLAAQFPTAARPLGKTTWFLLDRLTPRQRYEVRVCWPATQPTAFDLETFPLQTVQETPDLLSSLREYVGAAAAAAAGSPSPSSPSSSHAHAHAHARAQSQTEQSTAAAALLLRIRAAADYFTTDAALMASDGVPAVDADVVLDPFLLNVLPRSVAGTACYLVAVAAAAWVVAGRAVSWIEGLIASAGSATGPSAETEEEEEEEEEEKKKQ